MYSEGQSGRNSRKKGWFVPAVAALLLIMMMVGLRCVALDSDAYPRLSWSSALLTDEGFYLHNARNRILFGHAQTDQFNNALIMPVLDAVQTGVFHLFGVGAVSARAISVVLGLLTLPVFCDALRRAFGLRTAGFGLLLLGLDHVSLLYSRLALMDTPAAFVLVCAFWLWVRSGEGQEAGSGRKRIWLALCGLVLGVCYSVRGLGALVYPVPILLLGGDLWRAWRGRERGENSAGAGEGRAALLGLLSLVGGLIVALGVYGAVWYLPHRAELTRVNHYYLFDQLMPHSLNAVRQNVTRTLFGYERGCSSYLLHHAPVQFVLALMGLASWSIRGGGVDMQNAPRRNAVYLGWWLLIAWTVFGIVRYAPPRYYVIFYPALTGIAALVLSDAAAVVRTVLNHRTARTLLGGFLTYHLCEAGLQHASGTAEAVLYGVTALVGIGLFCVQPGRLLGLHADFLRPTMVLAVWAAVNALWLGDWLTHLRYTQRDADRWLAANLPANSVLIGDAAPGLCLNSRFVAVSVIPGLCNDRRPLETFAASARYVVILDGQRNTDWWRSRYPDVIRSERLKRTFPRLINFEVTVYEVPTEAAPASTPVSETVRF